MGLKRLSTQAVQASLALRTEESSFACRDAFMMSPPSETDPPRLAAAENRQLYSPVVSPITCKRRPTPRTMEPAIPFERLDVAFLNA